MDTIKDRLKAFIKSQNMRVSQFEKRCGLCNAYVNNIKTGIGGDKLESIKNEFPLLNTRWLMTGEGDMLLPLTTNTHNIAGDQINAASVVKSSFEGEWLVKMYEDLRAKDQATIWELKKALYASEYKCKALQDELAALQNKAAKNG